MAFIGVDFHTNSFTICRLHDDGSEGFETFSLSARALRAVCLSLDAADETAVESTGNTAWFCDEIRACVGRIVVVNPRQFQVIRKSVNKTDKNDARALAFFLSRNLLSETRLKSTAEADLSSLVATRDVFVRPRTLLLNKVHTMFVRRGMKLKKEGLTSKKRLRELDKAIEVAGADLPGHKGITPIKGIGSRSAASLLAGIGNMGSDAGGGRIVR